MIVKNLPANTTLEEIKPLFEKHGHIARFVMPKHGITVLVDYVEPFEAKKAFTKLAYSQFKTAPLYLEWAPENVFLKEAPKDEASDQFIEKEVKSDDLIIAKTSVDNKTDSNNLREPENDTTLFVKNLNFKTTEEMLKQVNHFLCSLH